MIEVSKDEYPFSHHYTEILGQRLHYLDEGSGKPVVMLHGNPTWSYYFRNAVKTLRSDYRCIVPDHIGCGYSDKPSASDYPYTLERRVEDIEALLDDLGLHQGVTLFLHDWGGMIGTALAVRKPERIERLIITNTGAFHLPKGKRLPLSIKSVRDTPLGKFLVQGLGAFSSGATRYCVTRKPLSKQVRSDLLAPYDSWKNREAIYHFVKDIPLSAGDPSYDLVTRVQASLDSLQGRPMQICWGDRDFVFDDHFLRKWVEYFPEARVQMFGGAGHYLLEDAWDEVAPVITKFLATT